MSPIELKLKLNVSKKKRPSWVNHEHNMLFTFLKELREHERRTKEQKPLRDTNLWTLMSVKLKENNIIRTPHACKLYWSRYGRDKAQFDERVDPKSTTLATSLQKSVKQNQVSQLECKSQRVSNNTKIVLDKISEGENQCEKQHVRSFLIRTI